MGDYPRRGKFFWKDPGGPPRVGGQAASSSGRTPPERDPAFPGEEAGPTGFHRVCSAVRIFTARTARAQG